MAEPHPALLAVAAGRALPDVADPAALARSAVEHGMGGLLLSELEDGARRRSGPGWAPVLLLLRSVDAATRRRHDRLWSGLSAASARLAEAGVDVAVAKGVVAEARWYARAGERPCNDVDLVLAPGQLDRVDDAIAVLEPTHPLLGRAGRLAARNELQAVHLLHEGVPVDLHWDLLKLGIPSRGRELLWSRTVDFAAPDGTPLRVLDAESSFLHFLVHLNKDRFARLMHFADVARIHRQEDLDLVAVAELAAADGLGTSVAAAWAVVDETLGLGVPPAVVGGGGLGARVRHSVWSVAWRPSIRLRGPGGKARFHQRQWLLALLAQGRVRETVVRFLRTKLPSRELLSYLHSPYAERLGDVAVAEAGAPRTYLGALTVGRVQVRLAHRRAARAGRAPDG